uniref:Methyltransferase domain-containing protein n=1 Tax=Leucosporidium scottii TaxID=5278 RepID=A0A0H5FT16_9BASI|nr:hypothetical protein ls5930a1_00147 [Leucosporidium scottii]
MDLLPEHNSAYGTQEYWDERYAREAPDATFDWLKKYEDMKPYIHQFVPDRSKRILHLGCGNSTLPIDMYDDGYEQQANLDYSSVVIEKQQALHGEVRPKMTWCTGDIRKLPFEDGSFDVCIDKGTMDAMMTQGGDPWNPPAEIMQACKEEVDEVCRVLAPGGIFLYLTWGQPHFRKRHLVREGWTIQVEELGGESSFSYFLYILRRTYE